MKLATVILLFQVVAGVAIRSITKIHGGTTADGKSDIADVAPKIKTRWYSVTITNETDVEKPFTGELEIDFSDIEKIVYPSVSKFLKNCNLPFTEENLKKIQLKQLVGETNFESDSLEKSILIKKDDVQFLTDDYINTLLTVHSQYNHQSNPLISSDTFRVFPFLLFLVIFWGSLIGLIGFFFVAFFKKNSLYLIGSLISFLISVFSICIPIHCWEDTGKKN